MRDANHVDNHWFAINDYNLGATTAPGAYVVNRHKFEGTVPSGKVTLTPGGVTPSDLKIPKFVRSASCLDIAVDATYDPATTAILRQRIEGFLREAPCHVLFRVLAFGDYGATFDTVVGGHTRRNTMQGSNVLTRIEHDFELGDQANDYLILDSFSNPTPGASFKLVALQLLKLPGLQVHPPAWTFRPRALERARCARFAVPIGRGQFAHGISSTLAVMPMAFRPRLRQTPIILGVSGSIDFERGSDGLIFTSASPSLSVSAASAEGARVAIGGFSSLSNGTLGKINTDLAAVLDADY